MPFSLRLTKRIVRRPERPISVLRQRRKSVWRSDAAPLRKTARREC